MCAQKSEKNELADIANQRQNRNSPTTQGECNQSDHRTELLCPYATEYAAISLPSHRHFIELHFKENDVEQPGWSSFFSACFFSCWSVALSLATSYREVQNADAGNADTSFMNTWSEEISFRCT